MAEGESEKFGDKIPVTPSATPTLSLSACSGGEERLGTRLEIHHAALLRLSFSEQNSERWQITQSV